MEAKHTPGPWHWDSDPVKSDLIGRIRYRVTAIGKTITQVYYSSFEGGPTNAEHDARLIAAAPELLEALRMLVAAIDAGLMTSDRINNARAAILKATGDQS